MSDLEAERAGRCLYWIHTMTGVLAGVALGVSAFGFVRVADAMTFLAIVAIVASLETIRVLVLSDRRPRR